MIKDLRKLTKEELLDKEKDLKLDLMSCHKGIKPKFKPQQRKNLKKELARIKTLLREHETIKI